MNYTLHNDISEDERIWGGKTWKEQVLHITTMIEQSWVTQPSVIEFCVLRVFIFICKLSVF